WNAAQTITNDRITVNKPRTNAKSTWLGFISLFLAQAGCEPVKEGHRAFTYGGHLPGVPKSASAGTKLEKLFHRGFKWKAPTCARGRIDVAATVSFESTQPLIFQLGRSTSVNDWTRFRDGQIMVPGGCELARSSQVIAHESPCPARLISSFASSCLPAASLSASSATSASALAGFAIY